MKAAVFVLSALCAIGTASPAHAQLGGLGKLKKLGDKAVDTKQKIDDMNFIRVECNILGEFLEHCFANHLGLLVRNGVLEPLVESQGMATGAMLHEVDGRHIGARRNMRAEGRLHRLRRGWIGLAVVQYALHAFRLMTAGALHLHARPPRPSQILLQMHLMIELDAAGVVLARTHRRELGVAAVETLDACRCSQCATLGFQIAVALGAARIVDARQ